MEFLKKNYITLLLFVSILILYMFLPKLTETFQNNNSTYTVYGSMKCGWTEKQLEYLKTQGKEYTFIDCDKKDNFEKCDFSGYPVTFKKNGKNIERIDGFKDDI